MAQKPVAPDVKRAALHSSPPRCAAHLTPVHCWISLFWCITFTWSSETSNRLKRVHFTDLLYTLFVCSGDRTSWGNCLQRRRPIRNRWTGWWPPRRAGAAAQLPLKIPACGCVRVWICVSEDDGGPCYGSEGATANRVPMIRVTDTSSNICSLENSLSHPPFSTKELPACPLLYASPPPTHG